MTAAHPLPPTPPALPTCKDTEPQSDTNPEVIPAQAADSVGIAGDVGVNMDMLLGGLGGFDTLDQGFTRGLVEDDLVMGAPPSMPGSMAMQMAIDMGTWVPELGRTFMRALHHRPHIVTRCTAAAYNHTALPAWVFCPSTVCASCPDEPSPSTAALLATMYLSHAARRNHNHNCYNRNPTHTSTYHHCELPPTCISVPIHIRTTQGRTMPGQLLAYLGKYPCAAGV
ncbi:hypothetical protein K439DRAFT_1623274 [Ramaria rubella]|nr:hypothetical protein K439DRAFT_1623274 [Ramaria rubella]